MKMKFLRHAGLYVVLCLAGIGVLVACQHESPAGSGPAVQPTLSSIQANILTPKCAVPGCHVPGGGAPMSLQSGASYGTLVNIVSTGYAPRLRVSPGDANSSVLYLKVIANGGVGDRMPTGASALSSDEISAIQGWINAGAPNN